LSLACSWIQQAVQKVDLSGRVVSEGVKNNSQQEKQNDVTAKYIILSSLSDNVFNRVYSCENAKKLWQTIIESRDSLLSQSGNSQVFFT